MKFIRSKLFTPLLCTILILFAVCIGAIRGWNEERSAALAALTASGDMRTQLENRGMDAANLAVVAARHLPDSDADLAALREGSHVLLSGTEDVSVILSADEAITNAALHLAETLPALESVQSSSRDSTYVTMLTATLGKKSSLTHTYTLLVEDFNTRLEGSLTGRLAMLLGVKPLPAIAQ